MRGLLLQKFARGVRPPLRALCGPALQNVLRVQRSLSSTSDASVLPAHIKFRMPDLDFEVISSSGSGGVTLSKWHIQEGDEVKDGAQMCEVKSMTLIHGAIDTPDLCFVLEAGDEGFIAKILVKEGAENVTSGQPLAIIVPTESAIQVFCNALKANPTAIEGYVDSTSKSKSNSSSAESSTPSIDTAEGSDVLKVLYKLQKDGRLNDEKLLKVLKSLARKNDPQLIMTYKGSFDGEEMDDAAFNTDFFVENALELAEEALAEDTQGN